MKLNKFFITTLGLGIISFTLALAIYFIKFHGSLSDLQGDWGTFGDFFGGVLNPILSFLALIAILVTINLQSQELQETRSELVRTANANEDQVAYLINQQKREDLFRLISKIVERVNNNYNKNLLDDENSIHAALIGSRNAIENEALFSLIQHMQDKESRTYKVVMYLQKDLSTLSRLLNDYELCQLDTSRKSYLTMFYKAEYEELVDVFTEYKWFNVDLKNYYRK